MTAPAEELTHVDAARRWDAVVVGAGLAGLIAARALQDGGADVLVLDKGRGPGGRLATRRIDVGEGTAVLDHGAQFFTVRSEVFARLVDDWPVHVWHRGPGHAASVTDDPSAVRSTEDGHPRYVGDEGMNGIAKHLAQGLQVRTSQRVTAVRAIAEGWEVEVGRPALRTPRVLLTAPVPQAVALLEGEVLPADVRDLAYDPCIGLLAVLAGVPTFEVHKALQFEEGPVQVVAENASKGISGVPAVTVHARGDWSAAHYDDPDEAITAALADLVQPWLGAAIVTSQVKRWRYATPLAPHADRAVEPAPGLVLAGDAFGGPKIEGAAMSGLAAAALLA